MIRTWWKSNKGLFSISNLKVQGHDLRISTYKSKTWPSMSEYEKTHDKYMTSHVPMWFLSGLVYVMLPHDHWVHVTNNEFSEYFSSCLSLHHHTYNSLNCKTWHGKMSVTYWNYVVERIFMTYHDMSCKYSIMSKHQLHVICDVVSIIFWNHRCMFFILFMSSWFQVWLTNESKQEGCTFCIT